MAVEQEVPLWSTDDPRPGGRRRRRVIAGLAVVAALACVAGAVLVLRNPGTGKPKAGPTLPTAQVIRTDLSQQTQQDGTLGYAHSYTVPADGSGRFTWLPQNGDVISRGQRVFSLNGHAVPLFYGSTPLWRTLKEGVTDGPDITELKRNLAALGYDDGGAMTIDDYFGAATKQAVKDYQNHLGVTQTGSINVGDVVLEPGSIRVTNVTATLGAAAHGNALTASDTTHQVSVNLPVTQEEIANEGAKVDVQLPGGRSTTGRISTVGTVATSGSTGQTGQGTQTATVPVTIELDNHQDAGRFDGAPVTVTFYSATHKGVLAVPVNALLVQPDGGYAVDVVESGTVRAVTVQLGLFAGGKVEVSGNGLDAGMLVEVPKS